VAGRRIERVAGSRRARRRGPGRAVGLGLGCVALVGLGVSVGSRIASRRAAQPATVFVTVAAAPSAPETLRPAPQDHRGSPPQRSASGAVAAASRFVGALDGTALFDRSRLGAVIRAAAAPAIRGQLLAAYGQASAHARALLGLGTVPAPVVIVRAASVGYRLENFSPNAAAVSLWRVGIIGSGATVQPEQSWRTETVSLVWTNGSWKVDGLSSRPGPTPPLAASAASTPVELFASIPRFEEFNHVDP
jgi:hypothetical protein